MKNTLVMQESVVIDLKRKLQSQQNVMTKATTSQQPSLLASYIISNEIVLGIKIVYVNRVYIVRKQSFV